MKLCGRRLGGILARSGSRGSFLDSHVTVVIFSTQGSPYAQEERQKPFAKFMQDKPKSDQLIELIADNTGVDPGRLVDDVSLFHDLGVAGLDGHDLLVAIGEKFRIDMTEVRWWDYFGAEFSYNPIHHLICFLQGKRLDDGIVRLQISDLKKTIEEGAWHEPDP